MPTPPPLVSWASACLLGLALPLPAQQPANDLEAACAKAGGRILGTAVRGHRAAVAAARFSVDGSRFVSAGADGTLKVWSGADGKLLQTIQALQGAAYVAGFSPDGQQVFCVGQDRALRFFQVADGAPGAVIDGLPEAFAKPLPLMPEAQISADGKVLYLVEPGAKTTEFLRFDLATAKALPKLSVAAGGVRTFDLRADGKELLAAVYTENMMRMELLRIDPDKGSITGRTKGIRYSCVRYAAQPDKFWAFNAARWELIKAGDGARESSLSDGSYNSVGSAAVAADGCLFVGFNTDSALRAVETGEPKLRFGYYEFRRPLSDLRLSPDGKLLLAAGKDGSLRIFDPKTGAEQWPSEGHQNQVLSLGYGPKSRTLVSGSYDNAVLLWGAKGRSPTGTCKGHEYSVHSAGFDARGRPVTGSWDGRICVWPAAGGDKPERELQELQKGDSLAHVAVLPSGTEVLAGLRRPTDKDDEYVGVVQIWSLDTGKLRLSWQTRVIASLAVQPDGKRLALSGPGGLDVYDIPDTGAAAPQQAAWTAKLEEGYHHALCFLPDGRLVGVHGGQGMMIYPVGGGAAQVSPLAAEGQHEALGMGLVKKAKLLVLTADALLSFSARSLKQTHELSGFAGSAMSLAISPDGKLAAVGTDDGRIVEWPIHKLPRRR